METEQLQKFILAELNNLGSIQDSRKLFYTPISRHLDQPNDSLVLQSSLQGLQSKEMIDYKNHETYTYTLSDEALDLIKNGSHEARVWACLSTDEGLDPKEIITKVGSTSAKVGQGRAFKQNWIKKVDNKFFKNVLDIEDVTVNNLVYIQAHNTLNDEKELSDLKKRKLIKPKKLLHFSIAKGPQYSPELITFETDLTSDMLIDGSWKNKSFKKYNFDAAGALPQGGALHPLLKVREEFRNIFFEMGFEEMPTNQFVESCFWNFDSLFVPQQHVARELQDTFYIKEPKVADVSDKEYYNKVKTTHESGGFGSIGYRAPFSEDETKRLVLRTHTTATSAQCLYRLAKQEGGFKPCKLFSIDRVFRNEAVDATHLAEFHQVEGVIADKNITLGDLIGFMEVFFKKMGMSQLRFKPAYNPYTEPSLEIFAHHDGLGKWVEIGNSGMFRPEMLAPMGLPDDVHVLGFGLSLERPTMIKYAINNIRDLVGHKVDIEQVEKSEAVRF
ncbi:Phenylalanine--tRNA ligase alpha subunit [Wallemia ichthyophaga EXF-994]|uniref:phenylalanine--tRNA ligase n=1 Tax=Wallemia ichthyophaga (strain EXF-994 / CBS 113033) TaxID=1299270 RepID=R9AIB1_WALI9|nr:Phenylalanine--tRNA ligase alpha subunit [Wallemia ichthyophaga EXF-994]EOR01959.1 Phenylalanine--tRNA ligase alpha subunit [Wallemia ichthyophaga EXF-994]